MLNYRFLISFILLLATKTTMVSAQQTTMPAGKFGWVAIPLPTDAGVDYRTGNDIKLDYEKYFLPVNEKEKVIPVRVSKNEWGVVKLNADGKALWQMQGTKDHLLGIGLLNDDILAIYADHPYKPRKISGILIDGKNGKRKKEKTIYQVDGKGYIRIKVQHTTNGIFNDVMIVTQEKKQTTIQVLYLDNELSISKQFTLNPSTPVSKFAGSIVNNSAEIFLADFSEEQLNVTRFDKDGKETGKAALPITRKSDDFNAMLQLDKKSNDALYIALNYSQEKRKKANRVLHCDFKNNKIISSPEQSLDKDYAKTILLEEIKGTYKGKLNNMEKSEIEGLVQWEDKVLLLMEIRAYEPQVDNWRARHISLPWIVSIYDTNLKQGKSVGLDKKDESFTSAGLSIGYHVQGDQLLIVSPALSGIGVSAVTFCSLNLKTEKIEKALIIENIKIGMSATLDAESTLWFDGAFFLQLNKGGNCDLHKVEL